MMTTFRNRLAAERRRLLHGVVPGEQPQGPVLSRLLARCADPPGSVVERAREVLLAVGRLGESPFPSDDAWAGLLPPWFVAACGPRLTDAQAAAEADRWRALTPDEQARWQEEHRWSLPNWLYWFRPENRAWFWWDAAVSGQDRLEVTVEADDWPVPAGALHWLLRAAGASRVEADPDEA